VADVSVWCADEGVCRNQWLTANFMYAGHVVIRKLLLDECTAEGVDDILNFMPASVLYAAIIVAVSWLQPSNCQCLFIQWQWLDMVRLQLAADAACGTCHVFE
jgi:hypothetical protein